MSRPVLALVLALVCVAGCRSTPVAAPAQPIVSQADPTLEPTAAPMVVPTIEATAVPTTAPTEAPTALPAAPMTEAAPTSAQPTAAPDQPPAQELAPAPVAVDESQLASCDPAATPPAPLPVPGSSDGQGFFRSFRVPLPPAPLYDPPGPKRVGLQAGHYLTNQVPAELRGLGGGAVGGGKEEWQVNLDVAERTAAILEDAGIQADVLPATVPRHYQANLFLAMHADGDTTGQTRGFKVARPGFSSIPAIDDRLVDVLNQAYGAETELPRDDEHISLRMRYYYAFNSRRYCHSVMPGVPQAIIEMAYLTNAKDRQSLIGNPQKLAQAIADGIEAFLATTP